MRLIDADTFSDEMRNRQNAAYELMQHSEKGSETNIRMDSAYAAFIECALTLDKMPTIDAVQVVRCKDCQYTDEPIYEKDDHDHWCREHSLYVYENDYCSYGERSDDAID